MKENPSRIFLKKLSSRAFKWSSIKRERKLIIHLTLKFLKQNILTLPLNVVEGDKKCHETFQLFSFHPNFLAKLSLSRSSFHGRIHLSLSLSHFSIKLHEVGEKFVDKSSDVNWKMKALWEHNTEGKILI